MKNKEIEKILKKMKTEEAKKVIAYINKLEREFEEEEEENNRLFTANEELIKERDKIINDMKINLYILSIDYKKQENEDKKMLDRIKMRLCRNILDQYKEKY